MVPGRALEDLSASRLANLAATTICRSFDACQTSFTAISRRAVDRFERRDWKGAAADATERLDLYARVIDGLEQDVRAMLGSRVADRLVWAATKAVFSALIAGREDWELAETFFNSVTRRIFATVGVDLNIEFVDSDFEAPPDPGGSQLWWVRDRVGSQRQLVEAALRGCGLRAPFQDLARDAGLVAERLSRRLVEPAGPDRIELISAPFFRRKGAYLVGRAHARGQCVPLGLALLNEEDGVVVDAVLVGEDDISVLFSFARSHFHVDLGPAHQLVHQLKGLMPRKSIAEIYIALGYHKHGKTELYRSLLGHLRERGQRFELAPGTPGLVMIVFAMPGHDLVFKLMRDRFPFIKPITPQGVVQNYRLVFHHDRAGRLVEAQEFEHLKFDRARFAPELLQEFRRDADRTVAVTDDEVVIHHAYVERRVTPLDLYLRVAPPDEARAAVVDFGQAVRDLAASGIFPGELLPKNFGVTRHGRVVCYDYDELSLLTDFSFRRLPAASRDEDEYADEAWFGVGPRDVFPEEFARFLSLPPPLREALDSTHGELYDVDFWQRMQDRVRSGDVVDIFPYGPSRRLRPDVAVAE
ncbi:MAG TPA: bifunctional isocitrate dehydrogenase kinase/phosphatase [Candidatus Dormibacteraeota bacterium]|nr:bifunctional isocitrate dehydrogenase kinase/phosphatase [Candidatus Dormibacteraeota bacterium]